MPFIAQRIDHVEVFVRDLDAAARWYRDVLGLEVIHRWEPEPIFLGRGGTALALFRAEGGAAQEPKASLRWHRVAWRTDREGFEEAQAHLKSHNIPFRGPVDHEIAMSIYFDDPDGNPLEITYYQDEFEPIPIPE